MATSSSSPSFSYQPSSPSDDWGTTPTPSAFAFNNFVLLAVVIFLFMVVVFIFLLYLYTRHYIIGGGGNGGTVTMFFSTSQTAQRGLDDATLSALPVEVFRRGTDEHDQTECSICLSELADGEKTRRLPKCGHVFHVECIDVWFHSHTTCPLCRCAVDDPPAEPAPEELQLAVLDNGGTVAASPLFPANVLFWGTQDGAVRARPVGTTAAPARERALVIDIPVRTFDGGPATAEEMRSPMSARLRSSLGRLFGRGMNSAAVTPTGDVEQGMPAAAAVAGESSSGPKTPKL